ncbi:MAG: glycosyltransferase [Candidatus Omnitrophica bacterium]|nr:glycosyltransferase [Candidatus Omnitrophota bacterium]
MKVAIVHDYLNQYGGAEKVIEVLHEIYPDAPIYTSLYDKEKMPDSFREMDVRVSFMQKLPFVKKHFKKYLPFFHAAFETFDLSEYDVVFSSSSAFAKCARTTDDTCHISYVHTPARFIWFYDEYIKREDLHGIYLYILPFIIKYLKKIDLGSSNCVDYFIANSYNVKDRIKRFYGKEAEVIYPPVECARFNKEVQKGDYFLAVSRLREYKRMDVAIETFNELGLPLKVIGSGSDRAKLEQMAKSNIEFLGRIDDDGLADYYSGCRALIFTGEEDLGIIPLEAMSAGRPVIAYKAGGALETVVEGVTGKFFYPQDKDALIKAVRAFKDNDYDEAAIRTHARKFDTQVFKQKIKDFVDVKYREFKK